MFKKVALLSLFLCFFIFPSCSKERERVFRKSTILMDTLVTVNVVSDSENKAEEAINEAFDEIKRIEILINFWSKDSELSEINRKAGVSPVKVSPQTLYLIEKALFISQKTDGAFDPTVGPLVRLWDFKKGIIPDNGTVKKLKELVDYKAMVIDKANSLAYLKKRASSFDTGGIAKGYAADIAVSVLKRKGIKAGLVAVAGDIKAFGTKPDGTPWRIGIRNPRPLEGSGKEDLLVTVELKDMAISTSGDYERFFIKDGKRYHHIIDPRTGYSATGCQSVTVIAREGIYADGFATGIFVLGPEKGLRLLKEMGFDGIIVDSEGKIHITEGLKNKVQWVKYW